MPEQHHMTESHGTETQRIDVSGQVEDRESEDREIEEQEAETHRAEAHAATKAQSVEANETTTSGAGAAIVPIPGSLRQDAPRPSLWRRLSLRAARSSLAAATGDDRLLARLDAIDARLESRSREIAEHVRRLDDRFSEVWEMEDQISRLTELEQTLTDVHQRQGEIDDRLRGVGRRLSLIAFLAATATAAALAALVLPLM